VNPNRTRIDVVCRTNLDDFKTEEWPHELAGVPGLGDLVASGRGKRLCIVAMCWLFDGRLELELHRP
jgi:hypothetical protein